MAPAPEAQQATLLQSAALPLLLQHSSVHTDVQAVLQLYCTSRGMQQAALQHCKGLLDISFNVKSRQHAERFAGWVAQRGQLMGGLSILPGHQHKKPGMYGLSDYDAANQLQDAEMCIAAALTQLQEQQGSLQLRALMPLPLGVAAEAFLQMTCSNKLIRLHLAGMLPYRADKCVNPSSIAALSQLQSLSLGPGLEAEQLLQHVLPALKQLTLLTLSRDWSQDEGLFSAEQYVRLQQQLPTQLKVLELRHLASADTQLAHLTALSRLNIGDVCVDEDSQLPEQLRELTCHAKRSLNAVSGCQQLQFLHILWNSVDAAELSKLTSLTSLTDLCLSYPSRELPSTVDAAAPAWPLLADKLRMLHIEGVRPGHVQAASVRQIKQLSRLTDLCIQCRNFEENMHSALPVTATEFAGVLAALTELRTLELCMEPGDHLLLRGPVEAAPAAAAGGVQQQDNAQQVQQGANGGLPGVQQDAAEEEQGQLPVHWALQLTALLEAQDDELLLLLQQQQQQQQELDPGAPDMLPVTAAIGGLLHLESLELKCSGINLVSVEPLTALKQLTRLTISGCHFDDAACINLVLSLTGLRRLSLGGSDHVSDASLVAIAKTLGQLTELKLSNCIHVTDRGVMQLSRLQKLEVLWAEDAPLITERTVAAVLRRGMEEQ